MKEKTGGKMKYLIISVIILVSCSSSITEQLAERTRDLDYVIYDYILDTSDTFIMALHKDYIILGVLVYEGCPMVTVMDDPAGSEIIVTFECYHSGDTVPGIKNYIGSASIPDDVIYHYYIVSTE